MIAGIFVAFFDDNLALYDTIVQILQWHEGSTNGSNCNYNTKIYIALLYFIQFWYNINQSMPFKLYTYFQINHCRPHYSIIKIIKDIRFVVISEIK